MSLLEVKPDHLDLIINTTGVANLQICLKFKHINAGFVVFKANFMFWDIWHGNKRRLKAYGMSVDKDPSAKGKWEVWMPKKWFESKLTHTARIKYEELNEQQKSKYCQKSRCTTHTW